MADITGADLLAKSLKEQGVQFMFGVVGFPVGPLAEAAQKAGLPYIGMRNEQTASYAAGAVGFTCASGERAAPPGLSGRARGLVQHGDARHRTWRRARAGALRLGGR